MNRIARLLIHLLAGALLLCAAGAHASRAKKPRPAPEPPRYAGRAELAAFAHEVAERRQWPIDWVVRELADARMAPQVRTLVMPPPAGTRKNWAAYRERFVEPQRIAAGAAVWRAHEEVLARAESTYGVPPELVVGILGVETFYGRVMGEFRVLDALATLTFDFPPGRSDRSAFFREQLEELLAFARREGVPAASIKGSFAGALGWPQFMPGSANRYAVDFDGDGAIDLRRSVPDAIGSVAAFLQAHGWQRGLPATHAVTPPEDPIARAALLAPDIRPTFTATQLIEQGARFKPGDAPTGDGLLALVELHNGDAAPTHVLGTTNFWALTRYNWSSYYAMAVLELGQAVKAAIKPTVGATPRP